MHKDRTAGLDGLQMKKAVSPRYGTGAGEQMVELSVETEGSVRES